MRFRSDRLGARFGSMLLAAVMVFALVGANAASIVDFVTTFADSSTHDETKIYSADLTLYDYYTDNEMKGGSDNNTKTSGNVNYYFNYVLYKSGYTSAAGTWDYLKYFPLYLGLQYSSEPSSIQTDDYNYSLPANSEAGTSVSAAAVGLVDSTLTDDGDLTQGGGIYKVPYFDEDFLTTDYSSLLASYSSSYSSSTSKKTTLGRVEEELKFNFAYNNSTGYYEYDSTEGEMGLSYDSDSKIFTAGDVSSTYTQHTDLEGGKGFFPWRYVDNTDSQNYGYGAKFEIEFSMSEDGCLVDANGNSTGKAIEFNFSGDDDVWVFIDDVLVLDVGGAHGAVSGTVNFKTKTGTTEYVKTGSYYHHTSSEGYAEGSAENYGVIDFSTSLADLYTDPTQPHTLTVYYIERGSLQSNCYISFNFQVSDTVEVVSEVNTDNVNSWFATETLKVTESESAEFVIASNGGTSTLGSPDTTADDESLYNGDKEGNYDYTGEESATIYYYTVTFLDTNGDTYTTYRARSGTAIVVPEYYYSDDYDVKTWVSADGETTVTPSGRYTVTQNITFSPVLTVHYDDVSLSTLKAPAIQYYGGTPSSYNDYSNYIKGESGKSTVYSSSVFVVNSTYGASTSGGTTHIKINSDNTEYGGTVKTGYVTVYSSSTQTYDVSSKSNYSSYVNSTVASWIEAYYNVYTSLNTYKTQIEALSGTMNLSDVEEAFNDAVTAYYDECYAGSSSVSTALSTALSNLATAIEKASYTSSYTTSGSVTFYVYASSTPTVTVSSPSGVSVTPTVTSIANPSGASDVIDGYSYYSVTVPTTYTETKTYTSGTTATETGDITYTIDGTSYTSSTLASYYSSGQCYDAYMSDWRELTEETSTTSYAYSSDTTLVWVYSTSSISSITYSATSDSYGLSSGTASAESDSYIPSGYYAFLVPSEVKATSGTTTTGLGASSVKVTVNGTEIDFSAASDTTCFTIGDDLNGALNDGDSYPIYAVVLNNKSYTHLYAYNSGHTSAHYPTSTNGYGPWNSSAYGIALKLEAKYSSNYYTWLPYTSGVTLQLNNSGSDGTGDWKTLQAKDYSYNDSDEIDSEDHWAYYMTPSAVAESIISAANGTSSASLTATASLMTASVEEEEEEEVASEDDSSETASVSATVSDSNLLASTANTTDTLGQYEGDKGTYSYATATNFKLFVDYNDKDNSVIRQTEVDGDGGFYLRFGQSAKFTAQFVRDYGLKISATGNYFTNSDSTSAAALSQVTPTSSDGTAAQTAMYNKYSTTWVLTDSNDVKITSDINKYGVNWMGDNDDDDGDDELTFTSDLTTNQTSADAYAIYFDNLATNASTDTGIYLTATYTSTVITSDLLITKEFTTAAKEAIATAQKSDSTYDPEFTFVVKFSNIFGGSSSEGVYTGSYSIVKIASDSSSYSYEVVSTGTATESGITLKYSQLVDGYGILIEGVPVETNYAIDEYFPTDTTTTSAGINFAISSSTSATSCKVDTSGKTVTAGSTSATPTVSNGTTYSEVTGTVTAVLASTATETAGTGTSENDTIGEIATYYDLSGDGTDWYLSLVNDLGNYYIQITKTINELYYGANDDPAGLLGTGALIGGATTSTETDPNGYEAATGAEQTFIFEITDSDGESFYVTLSFGEDAKIGTVSTSYDDDGNPYYTTTYTASTAKILVDASKTYTVSEVTGWSWKYSLSGAEAEVSPNSTEEGYSSSQNSVSSNVVTIKDYDSTNTATATFSNVKKTDGTEDIEGDTAVVTNKIIKPSSAA